MHEELTRTDPPPAKIPWWLWPHVLSLEAPVVIVAWQAALAHLHHARLLPGVYQALALAAWFVYLLDRVLDARRAGAHARLGARHAFYQRNQAFVLRVLIPLVALAMLWVALYRVPQGLLWSAGGIAALCGFYLAAFAAGHQQSFGALFLSLAGLFSIICFSMIPVPRAFRGIASLLVLGAMWAGFFRHLRTPLAIARAKEPVGALLIALGCSAGVWFFTSDDGAFGSRMELFLLWIVFYCNLAVISAREAELHAHDVPHHAGGTWFQRHFSLVPPVLLVITALCRWLAPMPAGTTRLSEIVLLAIALTSGLWVARRFFQAESFRVLADVCLLLPLGLVLV